MILHAYSGMFEFPEHVLELVGRGTKGHPLGHLWVQTWTDNDYLNLRALFDIISSSGRSLEEFFYGLGTLRYPSVRPTVRL